MEPIRWQIATLAAVRQETPRTKTFTFSLPHFVPHRPGQHYDLRLTAPDGYQAQRSYSIASAPERSGVIELTIDRIEDGEVSTYMHDVLIPGDQVELRGPIGGYFVWEAGQGGPLLLVGGGSGIVPLMAMVRHRAAAGARVPARILVSARSQDEIIYRDELDGLHAAGDGFGAFYTLTRSRPPGWRGYDRRVDAAMLAEVAGPLGLNPWAFLCGPTAFVETAAAALQKIGIPPARIKTERFGPSGS